jgi:hypothetical protein
MTLRLRVPLDYCSCSCTWEPTWCRRFCELAEIHREQEW